MSAKSNPQDLRAALEDAIRKHPSDPRAAVRAAAAATGAEVIKNFDVRQDLVLTPGWWADDNHAGPEYYPEADSGEEAAEAYVDGWDNEDDDTLWVDVHTWRVGLTVGDDGGIEEYEVRVETHPQGIPSLGPDRDENPRRARGRKSNPSTPQGLSTLQLINKLKF